MTDYVWHNENYDKRMQLTIDNSKINEDLINFPVLIHLSDSSGITSVDVTSVFDELTTSGTGKKIAVYTTSGTQDVQCYTEIENWVTTSGNEESWLWVKVPTISSGVAAHLYLYYDKDVSDNTSYIGDTGETPARNVWDNNFKAVYHLGEDPSKGYDVNTTHLDEDCANITDWTDGDAVNGESTQVTFDSKSCMKLDTNVTASGNFARRYRDVGIFGNRVVVEFSVYFDALGTFANTDHIKLDIIKSGVRCDVGFASDGLYVHDGVDYQLIGTNPVVQDVWQKWIFDIDFTTPASATVDIYLNDVLHAANVDCSKTGTYAQARVNFLQLGYTTNDRISYVDYIKVGDGFVNNIKDSTSNNNNGTPQGDMTSVDLVDGKVGKALDFDGSDDNIGCGSDSTLDDISTITIESTFKAAGWGESGSGRVISKSTTGNENGYTVFLYSSNSRLGFIQGWTTTDGTWHIPDSSINLDTWYHSVVQYDRSYGTGDKPIIYLNSVSQTVTTSQTPVGTIESDAAQNVCIAARAATDREFNGIIDEMRLSSVTRSSAWIKATYYSNWDNLITFGSEEDKPSFIFNGYVQVQGVPAARVVNLYHRSTGSLVGTATSNASTGYFEIPTSFNDYHFVNILPELSEDYNILVEDKIKYGS